MIPLVHFLIPHKWKEFVFHRGWSFNLTSILNAGVIIAGGREGRETRHTAFFTPLNLWCTEEEEEYCRRAGGTAMRRTQCVAPPLFSGNTISLFTIFFFKVTSHSFWMAILFVRIVHEH